MPGSTSIAATMMTTKPTAATSVAFQAPSERSNCARNHIATADASRDATSIRKNIPVR